jgi:Ala-tRNA(Pro) deacylase
MATATWVRDELDRRGVPYEELHHRDAYTAQQLAQAEHVSGHRVAKVVCVMVNGRPVEMVLPASRRVDLDWARHVLRADEVRLASEEEVAAYFDDCEVGAIPALRHWRDVDVIMDGHLCCDGDILLQGGTHRDAIRIRFDDWFKIVNPNVELLSEAPKGRDIN